MYADLLPFHLFPVEISCKFYLKVIQISHAEDLFNVINQNRENLRQWVDWIDITHTKTDIEKFIINEIVTMHAGKALFLLLFDGPHIVGRVSLSSIDWDKRESEIGYWLIPSYQGQGIVRNACKKLVEISFDDNLLGLNQAVILCHQDNHRSRKIPIKLGFSQQDLSPERLQDSCYQNYIQYVLYKD